MQGYIKNRVKLGEQIEFNPIRPGLFSHSPGPGGGWGLRGPDAKNQGQDQPIEMKLSCVITAIESFLMPNLRLIALLVLEI